MTGQSLPFAPEYHLSSHSGYMAPLPSYPRDPSTGKAVGVNQSFEEKPKPSSKHRLSSLFSRRKASSSNKDLGDVNDKSAWAEVESIAESHQETKQHLKQKQQMSDMARIEQSMA